jgi:hypothetical protein
VFGCKSQEIKQDMETLSYLEKRKNAIFGDEEINLSNFYSKYLFSLTNASKKFSHIILPVQFNFTRGHDWDKTMNFYEFVINSYLSVGFYYHRMAIISSTKELDLMKMLKK